jgi:lipid kinase YegS
LVHDELTGKTMKTAVLIINGKKAGIPAIRVAVNTIRDAGYELHVRATWEYGDGLRYVAEAAGFGADVVIAGGGDGTVNELAHGLALLENDPRPALGILPLGTANDFATGCGIPSEPLSALRLCLEAKPVAVDLVRTNDRYFINVASAGFGAAVTTETPVELKNFLAGGAYTLMGIIKAFNFSPYTVHVVSEQYEYEGNAIVGAICNGRQAGGGQVLAPSAFINDGLFDFLIVRTFPAKALGQVAQEVRGMTADGEFVTRFQASWLESFADKPVPVNLDGEPLYSKQIRCEIVPGLIKLTVPEYCPCIKKYDKADLTG